MKIVFGYISIDPKNVKNRTSIIEGCVDWGIYKNSGCSLISKKNTIYNHGQQAVECEQYYYVYR